MVDDTWRNFELSGKVSDYLAYRQRSGKTESGSDVDHSADRRHTGWGVCSYGTERGSDRNRAKCNADWRV